MNLFQEYKKQQNLRDWEGYLDFIPYNDQDCIVDLGCSVGGMSHVFSKNVKNVIGIDINQEFIDFCKSNKHDNETFICSDFLNIGNLSIEKINGVWSSFSLSYLSDPLDFLKYLNSLMEEESWIALLDISCFISGNLSKNSNHYEKVKKFELESYRSGIYDFDFGTKMQEMLEKAGFEIICVNNDVTDLELNFSGVATKEVIDSWKARLSRMKRLKEELGSQYSDFCDELLLNLACETHKKRENVKYVVAKKITR